MEKSNAIALTEYATESKNPIFVFNAEELAKEPAKKFHGLPNRLHLVHKAPIILTVNINASVGLFNGAKGDFIGPLYLPKKFEVVSFSVFQDVKLDKYLKLIQLLKSLMTYLQNKLNGINRL